MGSNHIGLPVPVWEGARLGPPSGPVYPPLVGSLVPTLGRASVLQWQTPPTALRGTQFLPLSPTPSELPGCLEPTTLTAWAAAPGSPAIAVSYFPGHFPKSSSEICCQLRKMSCLLYNLVDAQCTASKLGTSSNALKAHAVPESSCHVLKIMQENKMQSFHTDLKAP